MKFMNIYIWWIRPFVVHAHSWTCSWTYSWTIHEILTGEFMNVHEHSWTVIIHELFYSWTMSSWTVRKFMNCVHEVHELLQFMNWAICCSCTFMNLFMNLFMNYSWTIHEILTGVINSVDRSVLESLLIRIFTVCLIFTFIKLRAAML